MEAETSWRMFCSPAEQDVQLTERSHVERGDTCQIDINVGEVTCSLQETCGCKAHPDCLLYKV